MKHKKLFLAVVAALSFGAVNVCSAVKTKEVDAAKKIIKEYASKKKLKKGKKLKMNLKLFQDLEDILKKDKIAQRKAGGKCRKNVKWVFNKEPILRMYMFAAKYNCVAILKYIDKKFMNKLDDVLFCIDSKWTTDIKREIVRNAFYKSLKYKKQDSFQYLLKTHKEYLKSNRSTLDRVYNIVAEYGTLKDIKRVYNTCEKGIFTTGYFDKCNKCKKVADSKAKKEFLSLCYSGECAKNAAHVSRELAKKAANKKRTI